MNEAALFSAWHAWTAAAVILLICEVLTADFLPTTFAIACSAAAIAAVTGQSLTLQLIAFIVALLVILIFIRPIVRRSLYHRSDKRALNSAGLVGQTGTVVEPIGGLGSFGRVKLGGEEWRAICPAGVPVPQGAPVRVTAVDSAIIHVSPL